MTGMSHGLADIRVVDVSTGTGLNSDETGDQDQKASEAMDSNRRSEMVTSMAFWVRGVSVRVRW
jgi:hypothetical protein